MPFVRTNGIRLHYTERGQGEPLVLLMGLGAPGSVWEEHARVYERHFRCFLIDNRGAGQSDKPVGPYTTKAMAEDTLGLVRELGLEAVHLSGISMGSAIAQEVALAAPERVRSLTLNCSWQACGSYTASVFETLAAGYERLRPDEFQRLLQAFIYTPAYHEAHGDKLEAARRAALTEAEPMPAHAFRAQCDACLTHRTAGRLAAVAAPTLLTVGDRDAFTPLPLTEAIAAEMPQAELEVFSGSGHTHHWDRLDDFNRRTLDFLLGHRASGR
ncbi:alpha/beta fold hydrolase [Cohnella cellulosilytica]|uniref:Alpha/beta fold hydrolase n=1 Tax=Cohnella cellulosilytica TaxID=986710 RepID=A0ABW2F4F6_9BACL